MTEEQINSIFKNKIFLQRFLREIDKGQNWLLNYESGNAYIPEENGYGTVYTARGTDRDTGKEVVFPTIMESGSGLEYFGDKSAAVSKERGYGIPFEKESQADEFSILLSLLHELSQETESSYDIQGILNRLKSNGK